ncbi:4Fe-4S binding protein [Arboricoccus pini]|uniref:4Fe-4S binding protein n=1 Tax=Arboricoccus pini TaxID=1963835 RepID=UPI0013FD471A|nr:4Fe-4S binding protein [Arboricoccus pini]
MSLFWDPLTTAWTMPEKLGSPFRITATGIPVQDQLLQNSPYAMGARIFWTMVVPVLPLFLMVFGHEAWRRICPLSFVSQFPRYLGLQRRRIVLQRRTGKIERVLALIGRNDWLARHAWYVQLGLLFAGLTSRILLINSDRMALAVALLGVLAAAFLVGTLWGGKSWCNYFCPVNIVQKIYTEPRGLLESAPHVERPATPQSMCRASSNESDRSACVACTANCGDIDLERSYWDSIANPARRQVYYMFFGLIVGFYGYYYLYSGSGDYYFSGIWTHEEGALAKLMSPGLYLRGQVVPIPKVLAAPLVLLLAAVASLAIGKLLERAYRSFRNRKGRISEAEIVNHCLCVSAYVSINTFYLFGGRPNLLLLPALAMHIVDILIVLLTTMWLWQALQRSPIKYRREGMASSLLSQLKKLKVDVAHYLDGRQLDDLGPDELYLLTKVLPGFSHEQKLQAYRNVLDDAVATGTTSTTSFADLLYDIRTQMGISDADHARLLDDLGMSEVVDSRASEATSLEKETAFAAYRDMAGGMVVNHVEAGGTLAGLRDSHDMRTTFDVLQASLQVSAEDHQRMLRGLAEPNGIMSMRASICLQTLQDLLAARFFLDSNLCGDSFSITLGRLLHTQVGGHLRDVGCRLLSLLRAMGPSELGLWYASDAAGFAGHVMAPLLLLPAARDAGTSWESALAPDLVAALRLQDTQKELESPEGLERHVFRDVIVQGLDGAANLETLLGNADPIGQALTLTAFAGIDPPLAAEAAAGLKASRPKDELVGHWLLDEVLAGLLAMGPRGGNNTAGLMALHLTVTWPDKTAQVTNWTQSKITVGRAPGNDVSIRDRSLLPYHLAIVRHLGEVRVERLDLAPFFVDGLLCDSASAVVERGASISFAAIGGVGPVLKLDWEAPKSYELEAYDTVTRILLLAEFDILGDMPLGRLAMIAQESEVRRYKCGGELRPLAEAGRVAHLLYLGSVKYSPDPTGDDAESASLSARVQLEFPEAQKGGATTGDRVYQIVSEFAVIIVAPDWRTAPSDTLGGQRSLASSRAASARPPALAAALNIE